MNFYPSFSKPIDKSMSTVYSVYTHYTISCFGQTFKYFYTVIFLRRSLPRAQRKHHGYYYQQQLRRSYL